MQKSEKEQLITELNEKFARAKTAVLAEFSKLDVATVTQLRKKFRDGGVDYKVLKNRAGTVYTDATARATWKYDGTTFWCYDTPAMIIEKMGYVKAQGLGGAFFWEFSGDDAQGTLTKAISDGLN